MYILFQKHGEACSCDGIIYLQTGNSVTGRYCCCLCLFCGRKRHFLTLTLNIFLLCGVEMLVFAEYQSDNLHFMLEMNHRRAGSLECCRVLPANQILFFSLLVFL